MKKIVIVVVVLSMILTLTACGISNTVESVRISHRCYPTAICSVVVTVTETFYYLFWNHRIEGTILSIVFVAILIWKMILYLAYLKEFAGLSRWKLAAASVLIGIGIIAMSCWNGYMGVKCPVL